MKFKELIIHENATIKKGLEIINSIALPRASLLVIDKSETLVGTVAEGDIRRSLISGDSLNDSILKCVNRNYSAFKLGKNNFDIFEKCKKVSIRFVPKLTNDLKIIDIIDTTVYRGMVPATAVLMAGGKGERLKPLTDTMPKPLLKVGEKPIIDYNIENLKSFGIEEIDFILRHMHEKITGHVKQNFENEIQCKFIIENEPRGTAGSLSELKCVSTPYVILMNSDLLTNISFSDMYSKMIETHSDFVMATVPYYVDVPYAVIQLTDGDVVHGLTEKPRMTYYSNAGIYMFKKDVLTHVPENGKFDATDLIEILIKKGKKVTSFPITGYWLDIGRPEDFLKAQTDIQYINF